MLRLSPDKNESMHVDEHGITTKLPTMYRGTSLIRNRLPPGPYSGPMPMNRQWLQGGGCFLMSVVPMFRGTSLIRNSQPPTISVGP